MGFVLGRVWAAFLGVSSLLCGVREARAAEPTPVVFEGAEGCAEGSGLVVAVASRGRAIVLGKGTAGALRVAFSRGPAGEHRGAVTAPRADGPPLTRELVAASCQELMDATAIVVESSLDPVVAIGSPTPGGAPAGVAIAAALPASPPPPMPWATVAESRRMRRIDGGFAYSLPTSRDPAEIASFVDASLLGGVANGIVPGTTTLRLDLDLLSSTLLRMSPQRTDLLGLWRIRVTSLAPTEKRWGEATTTASAIALGIGPCLTYPYDRARLIGTLCVDVAAGVAQIATEIRGTTPYTDKKYAPYATAGADLAVLYHLHPRFHLTAKAGPDVVLGRIQGGSERAGTFSSSYFAWHALLGLGTTL